MQTKQTIMVVDADEELNDVVVEILSDRGYCVRGFCNARPALEAILAGLRPDLVLLGWRLPGMSGEQFLRHLDEHQLPTAILFFTSFWTEIPATIRERVRGVLAKPASLTQLLEAIEHAISSCSSGANVSDVTLRLAV